MIPKFYNTKENIYKIENDDELEEFQNEKNELFENENYKKVKYKNKIILYFILHKE